MIYLLIQKKRIKKIAIDEDTTLSGLIIEMIKEGYESRTNKPTPSENDDENQI